MCIMMIVDYVRHARATMLAEKQATFCIKHTHVTLHLSTTDMYIVPEGRPAKCKLQLHGCYT